MKHKVSELEGALLDAAVAKAMRGSRITMWGDAPWIEDGSGFGQGGTGRPFCPSRDWAQGGPIIEREQIATCFVASGAGWMAAHPSHDVWGHCSATPLIAAMRAYVSSRFGEEVELP